MSQLHSVPSGGLLARCAALGLIAAWLAGCNSGAPTQPSDPPDTAAPTAPTSLSAVAAASRRIELTWSPSTDNVGVSGYRIYRDGAQAEIASASTTAYSDTDVVSETEYTYTVRAFDAAGNLSEPSIPASATTPPAPAPLSSGLDTRPANNTCAAWPRPSAAAEISLERYTSLSFSSPIAMLQAPGDGARWFVVQQGGIVRVFPTANPASVSTFIDIASRVSSGGEMGLLGMAFHPDFPNDPRVFLSYTNGTPLRSRISAFTAVNAGATLDAASEEILLEIAQPEANHNGGHIAFGQDGYLYIGTGDGGGAGDDFGNPGNGQRLTTLLGKMLRIDIDGAAPYAIPPSNPFAQNARCGPAARSSGECPEIYAWGLRNPWRWSFDRNNGDLWVADVGQGRFEEVNRVTLGGNFGWRCREGAHDYASATTQGCAQAALIDPVTEYGRTLGNSITGGYVYRGVQPSPLQGRYLFGDFGSGRLFAWIPESANEREPMQLLQSGLNISAFGESSDGELYVVHYGGTLHRIVFSSTGQVGDVPETLSTTGCVSEQDPALPAEGLIPYTVNAPFWSDGAEKERWLALPNGQLIAAQSGGDWDLPNGSVLMKHFRLGAQLVETRLLMRHPDGAWGGFTYEWNAEQTDAVLVQGGAERDVGAPEPWIFPSETQCLECHTSAAGRSLGLETAQLNGDHTYPSTGRVANQLHTLSHIEALTPAVAEPSALPALPNPYDDAAPLSDRARAYLHTNCSFCHRPSGTTPSPMDLRYTTDLAATQACNVAPQSGDLGLGANARLILPGNAANSLIVERMNRRGEHAMPPLGSNQIDTAGVALMNAWIESLSGC